MAAKYKIATAPLYVGVALAHNVGDEVPVENIAKNQGWEENTAAPGSKAANDALGVVEQEAAPPVK